MQKKPIPGVDKNELAKRALLFGCFEMLLEPFPQSLKNVTAELLNVGSLGPDHDSAAVHQQLHSAQYREHGGAAVDGQPGTTYALQHAISSARAVPIL